MFEFVDHDGQLLLLNLQILVFHAHSDELLLHRKGLFLGFSEFLQLHLGVLKEFLFAPCYLFELLKFLPELLLRFLVLLCFFGGMVDDECQLFYLLRNSLGLLYFLVRLFQSFLNVRILFLRLLHFLFEGASFLSETLAFLSRCLVILGKVCILLL